MNYIVASVQTWWPTCIMPSDPNCAGSLLCPLVVPIIQLADLV